MQRLGVLGDVHGDACALERALASAAGDLDELVLVGDYIDRGSDSHGVLNLLIEAQRVWGRRLTLLKGNHEESLLEFLRGGSVDQFLQGGGLATVASYLPNDFDGPNPMEEFRSSFPFEHLALLESLEVYYETEDLVISHAGIDPADPLSRTSQSVVLGSHPKLFSGLRFLDKLVVCGHYVQESGSVYSTKHFVCLDSGCGTDENGTLSMLILPDHSIRAFRGGR